MMNTSLATLIPYLPPWLARRILQQPTAPDHPIVERFAGAALFADISGFTPLTEKLEQHGYDGPEELTRLLNDYFAAMIEICEAEGGEVSKFAGDALTVLFPARVQPLAHAVRRAYQAAVRVQSYMAQNPTIATSLGPMPLSVKIGIGAGDILNLQVGGQRDRWEDVLAGAPLAQMTAAEQLAKPGEIKLSPAAAALLPPTPLPPQPTPPLPAPAADLETTIAALRRYIPGAVRTWLDQGLHSWLAVLRPMTVMFVQVHGLNQSAPDFVDHLHQFISGLQTHIYRYQATLNRLAIGDKGTTLLILFGAPPFAHEDDPARAARCALGLQTLAETTQTELAIGIATGLVFAGPVGGRSRREYTVMADTVNLAARLMVNADRGAIWCDERTQYAAAKQVAFSALPPVTIKGKTHPIPVFVPVQVKEDETAPSASRAHFGRRRSLSRLTKMLTNLNQRQIIIVEGEAGLGKSHLARIIRRRAKTQDIVVLAGAGSSLARKTSYFAWHSLLAALFDLTSDLEPAAQSERIRSWVEQSAPAQLPRLPLLETVLGLDFGETAWLDALEPSLRQQNTHILIETLLVTRLAQGPLLLVIDDAQWLDGLSWSLLHWLARSQALSRQPLLLLLFTRPVTSEERAFSPLARLSPHAERLRLRPLPSSEIAAVAADRLQVPAISLPPALTDLVAARAGGNPFFAEEIIQTLLEQAFIQIEDDGQNRRLRLSGSLEAAAAAMPGTLHGLILARIDRLPPAQQLTLKVAAVIGRSFTVTPLSFLLAQHIEHAAAGLPANLARLDELAFTHPETTEPELTYAFRHIITRDVAYQSLLHKQRRALHQTLLTWYERRPAAEQERLAPLLASHSASAEDHERERHYTWLAGRQALRQYANEDAVAFFSQALSLVPASESESHIELLLAREEAYGRLGLREEQAADLAQLDERVAATGRPRQQIRVRLRKGAFLRQLSRFEEATQLLQETLALAEANNIPDLAAQALSLWGDTHLGRGDNEAAGPLLERAIQAAHDSHQPILAGENLRRLAIVNQARGQEARADDNNDAALAIFRAHGDRGREAFALKDRAIFQVERGRLEQALDQLLAALASNQAIGDRNLETRLQNATGYTLAAMGALAEALPYHQRSSQISHEIQDQAQESQAEHNLCTVQRKLGRLEAAEAHGRRALALVAPFPTSDSANYARLHLSYVLLAANRPAEARPLLQEAVMGADQLGDMPFRLEALVGLAAADLAEGKTAAAQARIEPMLQKLLHRAPISADEPLEMFHTCYQILQANADPRAAAVLDAAQAFLAAQADRLQNPDRRHTFLNDIPIHKQMLALWQAQADGNRPV